MSHDVISLKRNIEAGPGLRQASQLSTGILDQAEIELARLAAIVQHSHDAIVSKTMEGRILAWNKAAERLFGYSAQEAIGKPITMLFLPGTETEEQWIMEKIQRGDLYFNKEAQRRHKDGRTIDIAVSVAPILDFQGRLIGASKVARDITVRKAAEDELRRTGRELRQLTTVLEAERSRLLEAQAVAKVGSWETDLTSMSVSWTAETHRIHETDPSTFPSSHEDFLEIVHPEDRARVREAFETSRDGRSAYAIEHRLLLSGGRIKFIEERWRMFFDAEGRACRAVGTCQDISARKLAELKIRRLNRMYAVLAGLGSTIVRVRDRVELFRELCRLAVQVGEFSMAWAGAVDLKGMRISHAACEGVGAREFLDAASPLTIGSNAGFANVVDRAVFGQESVFVGDIENDPHASMKLASKERGIRSVAVLPLIQAGDSVGVVALYASEAEFFDGEERELLAQLARDISFALEHLAIEEKINYLSLYDPLTDLPNRNLFRERLTQALNSSAHTHRTQAVLIGDVERFRAVNQTFGRQSGDQLLKLLAERARRVVPDLCLMGRIGSDHFGFVIPGIDGREAVVQQLLERNQEIFGESFTFEGADIRVSMKFGIAMFPDHGTEADILMRNAEAALHHAKASGDRYMFYAPNMTVSISESHVLESKLRRAVEREEFVLHYQPKIDAKTRSIVGVEALIRWASPDFGLVPPARFIGLLEETGMITKVGTWVLRQAALDRGRWADMGVMAPRVAVNVSAIQLRQREFVSTVKQAILSDFAPAGIDLEITESLMMRDVEDNIVKLNDLRNCGVDIAIDDFGTGYSSLSYLHRLPIQALKIDRAFIATMLTDPKGMSLISTIISLAHSLDLKVIAEGVETEEQAKVLSLLRCDQMQGYFFCRPVPFEELTTQLQSRSGPTDSSSWWRS